MGKKTHLFTVGIYRASSDVALNLRDGHKLIRMSFFGDIFGLTLLSACNLSFWLFDCLSVHLWIYMSAYLSAELFAYFLFACRFFCSVSICLRNYLPHFGRVLIVCGIVCRFLFVCRCFCLAFVICLPMFLSYSIFYRISNYLWNCLPTLQLSVHYLSVFFPGLSA